jgi:hypothetical protein
MKIKELRFIEERHDENIIYVELAGLTLFSIETQLNWDKKTVEFYYIKCLNVIPRIMTEDIIFINYNENNFKTLEEAKSKCYKIVEDFVSIFVE